ncbi:hypothetical protein CA831_23500, partial [Burkholderia multivorans]
VATAAIAAERLLPHGRRVARIVGVAMLVCGSAMLASGAGARHKGGGASPRLRTRLDRRAASTPVRRRGPGRPIARTGRCGAETKGDRKRSERRFERFGPGTAENG